jgi:hypothetical protein
MGHVWDHTFRERLKVDPKECHILLTGARTRTRMNSKSPTARAHAQRACHRCSRSLQTRR